MYYKILLIFLLIMGGNLINPAGLEKTSAEPVELRGVIEGFYGQPWSQKERLDNLEFMGRQGLNMYIYAPKDDVYHRQKWREPYEAADRTRLAELIKAAEQNEVEFVFALSPGLDINLKGQAFEQDIAALVNKFSTMYDLGVRRFAIFFDDIEMKDGYQQARVINLVNDRLKRKYKDLKPLLTVPTEYFTADMFDGEAVKPYTKAFAAELDRDVLVMYTGEGVVCEGISESDIANVNAVYGRKMAVWWNYPVSDYMPEKLALGPISGMDENTAAKISAFIINPMEHSYLSRIAMQTGADYMLKPHGYDADESWRNSITEQYGELAPAMLLFAEHSQRMENSWAHTGRPDGLKLRQEMNYFWELAGSGSSTEAQADLLACEFERLAAAAQTLQNNLSPEIVAECADQLKLFEKLAEADKTALQAVRAKVSGQTMAEKRYQQKLQQQLAELQGYKAVLSENTLRAFIEETLKFLQ